MYQLHAFGIIVESKTTAIGLIKKTPELCMLVFEADPMIDTPGYVEDYNGPLLQAPVGVYELWVCRPNEPLIITETQVILGTSLLHTLSNRINGKHYLDEDVRETFSHLLARSEKNLHVFQEAGTGHRMYRMLWGTDRPSGFYDSTERYQHIGQANLETGEITK